MLTLHELPQRPAVVAVLVAASSVAVGALATQAGLAALVPLAVALALVTIARAPHVVVYYLIALAPLQQCLLRLVPQTSEIWTHIKRVDEYSLALLFPIAVLWHWRNRTSPLPRASWIGLALMLAIGVVATLGYDTAARLAALDAFLLLKGFMVFTIFTAFPLPRESVPRLLAMGLGIALFAAGFGLLEILTPGLAHSLLPMSKDATRLGRMVLVSIFSHEGDAGWFFAFAASVSFAFYMVYRRNGLLGLFALFSLCSLLTLRRKPLGGLAVVLLLAVLLARKGSARIRTAAVVAVVIATVSFAFGDIIVQVFSHAYESYFLSRDPSRVARNAMYLTSFRLAVDLFPLGAGFGRFGGYVSQLDYSSIYYEYDLFTIWGLSPTYNRYMMDAFWPHVLGQFGFFGLAGFGSALFALWTPLRKPSRLAPTALQQALALAAVLTFAEAFVESSATPIFESTFPSLWIFGLAGVAWSTVSREDTEESYDDDTGQGEQGADESPPSRPALP